MKILFLNFLFVFCFSLTCAGQTATVTPTPKPADENDVVKISTTLIQVDATVTDKKGKIVTDLKPEDFEIFENNQKQDITNFSFISAASAKTAPTPEPSPKNSGGSSVPVPPVQLRPEQVRRTIALVVDDLSLSFESTHFVREALKKFVDTQMQDGDLVAIVRTGGGIGALQSFTSDKRMLYAAIEKIRFNLTGNGKIGAFEPISSSLERTDPGGFGGMTADAAQGGSKSNEKTEIDSLRERVFATGTLGALNFIIKGMKELPGRKSVLLLSDGFRLYTNEGGQKNFSTILDSIRRLTDTANRSSVIVYTMDARGLQTLGFTAEDDTSGLSSDQTRQALDDRKSELFDTQDGLVYLARQTGGTAIINNNDISGGIKKMLNDQQGYYLIGYSPDSETFDAQKRRFNRLTIKVKRPDLKVRYRSGFFGVTDDETDRTVKQTPQQQIASALTSPFTANGIDLRLNTLFGNSSKSGAFVRSLLHVEAKDLKFSDETDGTHKATFDILAISYDERGLIADQIAKTYTITLKKDTYQEFLRDGFVYNFVFPIKKPGAYQMRVAVRDSGNGKVGSANQFIEVPNVKKGKLTLSGIILKNLTVKEFESLQKGILPTADAAQENSASSETDTSLRQFKRGTVLRYGFEVYNAKSDNSPQPLLTLQTRIFRDGQLLLDGKPAPIEPGEQKDFQKIVSGGALSLGSSMLPGDYVLQIIVADSAKKNKIASQWVQFEVTAQSEK